MMTSLCWVAGGGVQVNITSLSLILAVNISGDPNGTGRIKTL